MLLVTDILLEAKCVFCHYLDDFELEFLYDRVHQKCLNPINPNNLKCARSMSSIYKAMFVLSHIVHHAHFIYCICRKGVLHKGQPYLLYVVAPA